MKKIISKCYPSVIEIDTFTGEITSRPMTRDELNDEAEREYWKARHIKELDEESYEMQQEC